MENSLDCQQKNGKTVCSLKTDGQEVAVLEASSSNPGAVLVTPGEQTKKVDSMNEETETVTGSEMLVGRGKPEFTD